LQRIDRLPARILRRRKREFCGDMKTAQMWKMAFGAVAKAIRSLMMMRVKNKESLKGIRVLIRRFSKGEVDMEGKKILERSLESGKDAVVRGRRLVKSSLEGRM
jgi:hypothetical protein